MQILKMSTGRSMDNMDVDDNDNNIDNKNNDHKEKIHPFLYSAQSTRCTRTHVKKLEYKFTLSQYTLTPPILTHRAVYII